MKGIQASFFILLEAFVVVTGFSHSAYFTTRENKRLIGHRIKQVDSVSLKSCSQFCLRLPWCTSTNFQISTKMNGKESCELNMHGIIDENDDHFHDQEGVTFSLMLKGCLLTSCLNGGSCVYDKNKKGHLFSCLCKIPWTGKKCENKNGIGWIYRYPALSCKNIRDVGDSKGDGEYWIDPAKNGKPFKVYCDMTTDGGGWLLISNIVKGALPIQPSLKGSYDEVSLYNEGNIVLNRSAMKELRSNVSFTQLRFFCSKQQGRTFHVTTTANSTGEAVVQYFSGQTDARPDACGSFVRMEDDNSAMSQVCKEWGGNSTNTFTNKWGDRTQDYEKRLYRQVVLVWHKYHWLLSQKLKRFECDDFKVNVSKGDFWKIYVR